MRIFLRCMALVSAILLALYPLGLHGGNAYAIACGVAGVVVVGTGLILKRAWTGALAAGLFCVEYLLVLITGSIAFDAFVLVEAILVLVLLESTDLASARAERIEVPVLRSRFLFMAGALLFGSIVGTVVLAITPAVTQGSNAMILVIGAVAALAAGLGVLIAMRRVV
jgi:hypothetical protein